MHEQFPIHLTEAEIVLCQIALEDWKARREALPDTKLNSKGRVIAIAEGIIEALDQA